MGGHWNPVTAGFVIEPWYWNTAALLITWANVAKTDLLQMERLLSIVTIF